MQNIGKQVHSQLLPWLGKITPVRLIKIIVISVDVNGCNWAGSGMSASVRGSMNSCRLGWSGRLAVAANFANIR